MTEFEITRTGSFGTGKGPQSTQVAKVLEEFHEGWNWDYGKWTSTAELYIGLSRFIVEINEHRVAVCREGEWETQSYSQTYEPESIEELRATLCAMEHIDDVFRKMVVFSKRTCGFSVKVALDDGDLEFGCSLEEGHDGDHMM